MKVHKALIVVFILAVAILCTSIYINESLRSNAKQLNKHIVVLELDVAKQNWTVAKIQFKQVYRIWKKTEKAWTLLIDHTEIDNINISFQKLRIYIDTQDRTMALAEIAVSKKYIQHIPEKEKFKIRNVF